MKTSIFSGFALFLILAYAFLHGVLLRGDEENDLRLLDFTVVAVDSQGQPVNDLTSSEFQVTDAGKRRQIAFFRHDDSMPRQTQPLGPHEFSNRGSANPHVTLVLFDLLNERFATRGFSSNQLVHDLARVETADDLYLYLLTLEGRLFAVHGFSNPERGEHPKDEAPWTRGIKQLLDDALRAVLRNRPVDIDNNVRVQLTLNALDTTAGQLSMFPGRKNVVWVTDGVPIELGPRRSDTGDFVDFTPQLRLLSETFDRSGAAIYPVAQVMIGSPDMVGGGSGAGSHATLDDLAGMTGGRPTGSKDIGAAVRQAITDARTSYQIGYYAPARNWDSKFHKLRITCTRKGVRIQARTGYYAWPEPPGARAERAIETTVEAGFDAAEIGLRGTITPDPKNPQSVRLALRIDAENIALAHNGDRYAGQLRLAMASFQSSGQIMNSAVAPLDLNFSASERDKVLKDGIDIVQDVTLDKDVNRFKVVIFDRGSNTVGSLTIPIGSTALN